MVSREELSGWANDVGAFAARIPGRGYAPRLRPESAREDVIAWLQWNDPNGVHTDALATAEDIEPYTLDGAWEALAEMFAADGSVR